MILNYLGSKARFIPTLDRVIGPVLASAKIENKGNPVVFGDLFSGTGFVANYYKDHGNISKVVSSDLELYSYVVNRALLQTVCNNKITRILAFFNSDQLKPVKGLIWKHFSPAGGRLFYTEANAMRIDAMRIAIGKLYQNGKITYKECLFLLASLMVACSKFANNASCFRAYLKKFCPRSLKKVVITPIHKNTIRLAKPHEVIKNDAARVAKGTHVDVAYLDPPYNANHYGGYYSFYNYLLVYNPHFQIGGVAGVTKIYNKSDFGLKATSKRALKSLIEDLRKCKYIVLSYNSDGVLKKQDLFDCLRSVGNVTLYKTVNKKFRPNANVKNSHVVEYIFVVKCVKGQYESGQKGSIGEDWILNRKTN